MKKTRLIKFNWEKYENGMKAVFRRTKYLKVINIYNSLLNERYPIIVHFTSTHNNAISYIDRYDLDGSFFEDKDSGYPTPSFDKQLMLEEEYEEPEQKTFWVNVYDNGSTFNIHYTEEKSKYHRADSYKGTLKVTYTDEDLIK